MEHSFNNSSNNKVVCRHNSRRNILSPARAFKLLENGVSSDIVLSMLDVDGCHFMPRLDDLGEEPLITTGVSSYTMPSSGQLCFSLEDVECVQKAEEKAILVFDCKLLEDKDASCTVFLKQADGFIISRQAGYVMDARRYSHFLIDVVGSYKSVLLDNPSKPQIEIMDDCHSIKLANGSVLKKGDLVTIDPVSRRMWNKELPILPPDEKAQSLLSRLNDLALLEVEEVVALHSLQKSGLHSIVNLQSMLTKEQVASLNRTNPGLQKSEVFRIVRAQNISRAVGLYRTDTDCFNYLSKGDESVFADLSNGIVPDVLGGWDSSGFRSGYSLNYRLPDINNLRSLMPDDYKYALDIGDEHEIGTPLFKARETLYKHQIITAFDTAKDDIGDQAINIIVPSVETLEEVAYFKKMFYELTPEKLRERIGFGVMIETEAALDNTAAIATQCDCLCYGTNDLTAAILKLSRGEMDYSEWMGARGHNGSSPFEVFVPEVLERMERSIREARRAKPADIKINICGQQVAGHDIDSILAVLKIGADMVTVPATEEHFNRARLAIAQHMARIRIGRKPCSVPEYKAA